jgi:hypothetical protein
MLYLFLILASIGLFAAFLGLTVVEARAGTRVLSSPRAKLDKEVSKVSFIITHVRWGSFFLNAIESISERIVHDIAHWSLIFVRFMERELTETVRYLRDRRPNMLAPKPSRRPLVEQVTHYVQKTLKGFVSSDKK